MTPDDLADEQFNRIYRKLKISASTDKRTLAIQHAEQARQQRRAQLTDNLHRLEALIEAADTATRKIGVDLTNSLDLKLNEILQSEMPDAQLQLGAYEPSEISSCFQVRGFLRELTGVDAVSDCYVKIVRSGKEVFRSSTRCGVWNEAFQFEAASTELILFEVFEIGLFGDKQIGDFKTYPVECKRKRFPLTTRGLLVDMRLIEYRVFTFFVARLFMDEPGDYQLTMELFRSDTDGRIVKEGAKELPVIATEIDRFGKSAADVWQGFEFRIVVDPQDTDLRFAAILWKKTVFGATAFTRELMNEVVTSRKITAEAAIFLAEETELWRGGEMLLKFPGPRRTRIQADISARDSSKLITYSRYGGRLRLPLISDHPISSDLTVDTLEENTVEVALLKGDRIIKSFAVNKLDACQPKLGDTSINFKKFTMYRLMFRASRDVHGRFGDRKLHVAAGDWMSLVIFSDGNPEFEIGGRKFPDVKHFICAHTEAPFSSRFFRSNDDLAIDVTVAGLAEIGSLGRYAEVSLPPAPFRFSADISGLGGKTAIVSVVTCETHPEISACDILSGVRVNEGSFFDIDLRTLRKGQTWLKIEEIGDWKSAVFSTDKLGSSSVPLEVLTSGLRIPLSAGIDVTLHNVRFTAWKELVCFEPASQSRQLNMELQIELKLFFGDSDENADFVTQAWLPLTKEFPISLEFCPPEFRLRACLSSLDGNVRAVAGPIKIRTGTDLSIFTCGPSSFVVKERDVDIAPTLAAATPIPPTVTHKETPKFIQLEDLMLPSLPSLNPEAKFLRIFVVSAVCSRQVSFPCQVCAYFLCHPAVVMAEAKSSLAVQEPAGSLFVFGEFLDLAIPRSECSLYISFTTERNQILGYVGFPFDSQLELNRSVNLTVTDKADFGGTLVVTMRAELEFR